MKRVLSLALICVLIMSLTACSEKTELQDGYYTAQASEFNHGWKEYITIMVKGGSIVSVEYNAENASGFIKSWDNAYMQTMLHSNGTYPNEYTRYYAGQLLEDQNEDEIDALTGATSSYTSFQKLSKAVLEQARKGDSSMVFVDTSQ
ncbi:MAG: FMN-binding protein [Lachnospiraceae bacterium]|nr:FMN-binding protein [Lachnospiraceae bacterium]MCI8826811.1 FMN-binding protein [Lachnospiraceae bacterium]MCI9369758.1 FMN-binding protein [Lachnospiraceae bacterium]